MRRYTLARFTVPGYPGEGHTIPIVDTSYPISAIYDPAPESGMSLGAELFVPSAVGSITPAYYPSYYLSAPGLRAARRGGAYSIATSGLFALHSSDPVGGFDSVGFRGGA